MSIDYSNVHIVAGAPHETYEFPSAINNADIATTMMVWYDRQNNHTYATAYGSVFDGITRFDGIHTAKEMAQQFISDNAAFYEEHLAKAGPIQW